MSGAPAETWRKFRFATAPRWTYALLALICLGLLGLVVGIVVSAAVSRRASGYLPLTRSSSRAVALASWIPAGLVIGAFVVWFSAAVLGIASSSSSSHVSMALVYTTWVADAKVTSGPELGYKPALTEITGKHITSVSAVKESSGDIWDLDLSLDSTGAQLLSAITRDNVAACPGDSRSDPNANCPERYLALWLGLTQSDIDNWEDYYRAQDVSRSLVAGCPAVPSPGSACGKLVINAVTIEQIDGGEVAISGFSQKNAQDIVAAIQPRSSAAGAVGAGIAWVLAGVGLLAFLAGLIGAILIRRLIGPHATVMEQQPGAYDRLVELRHVHPVFVVAVIQAQQARAAQYSSTYAPQNPPLPPGSN